MTRKNEKVSEAQISFLPVFEWDASEIEFLNSLSPGFRELVEAYAYENSVTPSKAWSDLLTTADKVWVD